MKPSPALAAIVMLAAAPLFGAAPARAQEVEKPADAPSLGVAKAPPSDDDAFAARYPPTSTRWKVMGGGLGLTALGYGLSYFSATQNPKVPGLNDLKIPIVGPWIAIGHSGCANISTPGLLQLKPPAATPATVTVFSTPNGDCGSALAFRGILLVVDGLMQAGGLGLILTGILMKTEAKRPTPVLGFRFGEATVEATPLFQPTLTGIGLSGTF